MQFFSLDMAFKHFVSKMYENYLIWPKYIPLTISHYSTISLTPISKLYLSVILFPIIMSSNGSLNFFYNICMTIILNTIPRTQNKWCSNKEKISNSARIIMNLFGRYIFEDTYTHTLNSFPSSGLFRLSVNCYYFYLDLSVDPKMVPCMNFKYSVFYNGKRTIYFVKG